MEPTLYKAQTEPEVSGQRAAIADWGYWQRQSSVLAEALESSPVA